MISFSTLIPKKCQGDAKHCDLCKNHGDTHSQITWRFAIRMRKMGHQQWALSEESNSALPDVEKQHAISIWPMCSWFLKFTKLKKSNRKLKWAGEKHKHNPNSYSYNIDSSWSDGHCSMEESVISYKQLTCNNKSIKTYPSPIKSVKLSYLNLTLNSILNLNC